MIYIYLFIFSVNSVSSTKRTVEEAKKKYADLKSITKKKERRRRLYSTSTGGGRPADALEDWEEKVSLCSNAFYI